MPQRKILIAVAVLLVAAGLCVTTAHAQTYSVLYDFGTGGTADPCQPQNPGIIAQGQDGNLYSTGPNCGSSDGGAIFEITPGGIFTVTYEVPYGGPVGPFSGLTLGGDGNFYGATHGGGSVNDGTIFNVTPGGTLSILHSFTGGSDGYTADAPPILGSDGNYYGTARRGGNFTACSGTGCGTVYQMTPSGTVTSLYEFDIKHGLYPWAPLVQGSDGNFYGTTVEGGTGAGSAGVVFKITPAGTLTVLHNFCSKAGCADGQYPYSPLVQGSDGNFYGTTVGGGANGYGEVFKISPGGSLTVLHSMNSTTDGRNPYAGLALASDGNFYGTNQLGGTSGGGTLFKITSKGALTVLYNFNGATGSQPLATMVEHTNGILYGDTYYGGTASQVNCSAGTCGVFYSLNANLKAFVRLVPGIGTVGSTIGILGQGFSSSSVVKFNGVKATTVSVVGATFIQATVPPGNVDGYVTVTTGTTTLKSLQKFAVHDAWRNGTAMPIAVRYPATGTIKNNIYVVGGVTTGGVVVATNQVYNATSNKWTTAAPLPVAVADAASAVVDNILYVIGGSDGTNPLSTVYAYDPTANAWSTKSAMPTARFSAGAAVEGGLIYVVGGNGATLRLTTVESYNPATDTWTEEAPLLVGKSEPSVGLIGSTIVAAGGYTASGDTGDNEGYDAATNAWSALTSDPTPRNASCAAAIGGNLYVAGGGTPVSTNESFNLAGNSWTRLAPMLEATTAPGQATANGLLYCFGGGDTTSLTGGNYYNYVQIYQP